MKTKADLWKEFEEHMQEEDTKSSTDVPVGGTDKGGNLLVLGGHKVNLWRLKNSLYEVAGEKTPFAEEAVKIYNLYNGTSLSEDYIPTVFEPWYQKQFKVVISIPSDSRPGVVYEVRRSPDGKLLCECEGFRYRGSCKHLEYVKSVEKESKVGTE